MIRSKPIDVNLKWGHRDSTHRSNGRHAGRWHISIAEISAPSDGRQTVEPLLKGEVEDVAADAVCREVVVEDIVCLKVKKEEFSIHATKSKEETFRQGTRGNKRLGYKNLSSTKTW